MGMTAVLLAAACVGVVLISITGTMAWSVLTAIGCAVAARVLLLSAGARYAALRPEHQSLRQ